MPNSWHKKENSVQLIVFKKRFCLKSHWINFCQLWEAGKELKWNKMPEENEHLSDRLLLGWQTKPFMRHLTNNPFILTWTSQTRTLECFDF